jgi:hypothetical protein
MSLFFMLPAGQASGVINITGASIEDSDLGPSGEAITSVHFNADGTVDKTEGAIVTQLSTASDWVIPNEDSAEVVYIRATEISYVENETNPNIFGTKSGDSLSTWLSLGGGQTREWILTSNANTAGDGTITWVIDVEIATDAAGANIIDIGRYTMVGNL